MSFFWLSVLFLEKENFVVRKPLKKFPKVTIFVAAYNEEKVISKCLDSLLTLNYPKSALQILVLANACKDKTAEIARKYSDKGIEVIEIEEPGKANALNIGLKYAKGEFSVVFDADCFVTSDLLEKILPNFEDPAVGAVKCSCKVHEPKTFLEKLQWFEYLVTGLAHRLMAAINVLYLTNGAFSVYRTSVLKEVGGFDTKTLTEDIEIAMHLLHQGYKVKSELLAKPSSHVPSTFFAFHRQRVRWARGFFHTMYKYKNMVFNAEYGLLGALMLPVSIIVPSLLIVFSLFTVYSFAKQGYVILLSFMDSGKLLQTTVGSAYLLSWNFVTFFTVVMAIIGVYFLAKSHKHFGERWTYPLVTIAYITIYQFFLSFYWVLGLAYELVGAKRKW